MPSLTNLDSPTTRHDRPAPSPSACSGEAEQPGDEANASQPAEPPLDAATPLNVLLPAATEGDRNALSQLLVRYERLARATARRVVQARLPIGSAEPLVEDITQEALVLAMRRLHQVRQPAAFPAWLQQLTRREARRMLRHQQRTPRPTATPPEPFAAAEPSADEELQAAVDRLPADEQVAITAHYFDGLSVREVADREGCSVGTLTKRLSRARDRLRRWLRS